MILCTEIETKSKPGTRREGPPFPFNLSTKYQKFILQILILEKKREEELERGGGAAREKECC